jgi:hypothetical protein
MGELLDELMTPRKQELQPATMNTVKKSTTQIKDGVIRKMPGWRNLEGNGKDIAPLTIHRKGTHYGYSTPGSRAGVSSPRT